MKTISQAVSEDIKSKPFLSSALNDGIINLTSLSRQIKPEIEEILRKKLQIEKKNLDLMREHKYLKNKIKKLQLEVKNKLEIEENFNKEIDELTQETENLVSDIEKWQM